MHAYYPILGMMLFFCVFLTIVFRLEKKMVWPYGDVAPFPPFGDNSGYGQKWVSAAAASGYKMLGWCPDMKGPTYRINYAMLVSPENDTLAIVGVGTLMNMAVSGVWLHTPVVDGRSFCSTNSPSGLQLDMSGEWLTQFAPQADFPSFLARHREWLQSLAVAPRKFSEGAALSEFRSLREQHFRSMERAGLISYTDGSATHFRYTFVGAAKTAIWSYFSGMMRRVTAGRIPRTT